MMAPDSPVVGDGTEAEGREVVGRWRTVRMLQQEVCMFAMSGVGWFGLGIVGLIILIALAFWPARVARRKGHSWLLFFIFSLFLFFPALIVAYVVRDRRRI